MISEKALYVAALGVLALGVSHSVIKAHTDWARCLADQSDALVNEVSGQAMRYAAMAEMVLGRGETRLARTQTAMVHAQTRIAFTETAMARHQAQMIRLRTERVRVLVNERMQRAVVVCPRQRITLDLPQPPATPRDEPSDDKI
jgi:DNA-binding helix-hairpin-helix protein with protein kinase domain